MKLIPFVSLKGWCFKIIKSKVFNMQYCLSQCCNIIFSILEKFLIQIFPASATPLPPPPPSIEAPPNVPLHFFMEFYSSLSLF